MADNKRYYYLKLKDCFFDSEEMKVLESLPNGIYYSNLLIKLYLKSLKFSGALRFNDYIPYDENMIATITSLNVDIVKSGLKVLSSMKLIERLDDGTIYMMNIQSFIGKSSSEGDRKRLYRERIEEEKQLLGQLSTSCPISCGINSDKHTPETDKDIETDSENKERDEIKGLSIELMQYFENITGMPGSLNPSMLQEAVELHEAKNVKRAIDCAVERNKPTMSYINGILKNWAKEGYPEGGDLNGRKAASNEFAGFKPNEPRVLSEDERRSAQGELL